MEWVRSARRTTQYHITCEKHEKDVRKLYMKSLRKNYNKLGINISEKSRLGEILHELGSNDWSEFASIFILVDLHCCCHNARNMILKKVYMAIRQNETLRYVSKLVCCDLTNIFIRSENSAKCFKRYDPDSPNTEIVRHPKINKINQRKDPTKFNCYVHEYFGNDIESNIPPTDIENLIYVEFRRADLRHIHTRNANNRGGIISNNLHRAISENSKEQSVQQMVLQYFQGTQYNFSEPNYSKFYQNGLHFMHFNSSWRRVCVSLYAPNVENYIFNRNAALAITINTFYYADRKIREGSIPDLQKLKKLMLSRGISHMILPDANQHLVKELIDLACQIDYTGLETLHICIMGHGGEKDTIFTDTGSYNIHEDIIRPLQANRTLRKTLVVIIVVACRGTFDLQYAIDPTACVPAQTNVPDMPNNFVLVYSTLPGLVSYLYDEGSDLIQTFCKILARFDVDKSYRQIFSQIDSEIRKKEDFYDGLDRIVDFYANSEHDHVIRMKLVNEYEPRMYQKAFQQLETFAYGSPKSWRFEAELMRFAMGISPFHIRIRSTDVSRIAIGKFFSKATSANATPVAKMTVIATSQVTERRSSNRSSRALTATAAATINNQ